MNKKGFTLVELLAVIVLLVLLVTIAVPSSLNLSKKIKENMFCSKINDIETTAKLYGEDRRSSLTGNIDGYKGNNISVKNLVESGYLRRDQDIDPLIIDPRDNKSDALYNMQLGIYIKNNRVYVKFPDDINTTCGK